MKEYPVADRFGNPLSIGDQLYIASKNEVYKGELVKIAPEYHHHGYGCCYKKLTVFVPELNRKLTINIPQTTIKICK